MQSIPSSLRSLRRGLVLAAAAAWGLAAWAQPVYRIVGPDGRVTYSDRPPVESQAAAATPVARGGTGGGSAQASLPFELRRVAQRYPVVLHTGNDCPPCNSGRNYLTSRGIPFAEKTVSSAEDVEALKRLAGQAQLPLLTIGSQQVHGFSETEWGQYLDAAGYPRSSRLPAGWRHPRPEPLVALQPAQPQQPQQPQPAAEAEPPRAAAPSLPPPAAETPANPAGIRF